MADQNTQDLYSCNGCSEKIPTGRARIACHTCPDYHLCANCFVIKQFSRPHSESHTTMILKSSGFVVPSLPGFAPRAAPALPPRQNSARQSVRVSEMPTANWGALWNIMKAPLEKMDKKNRKGSVDVKEDEFKNVELRGRSPSVMTGGLDKGKEQEKGSNSSSPLAQNPVNSLPPSPPKCVLRGIERVDSSAPSYPRPAKWESLFEADGTPRPIFVALMSTIFSHLDPDHTEYLRPETYSAFLDVQGCDLELNSWKRTLQSDDGDNSKDIADFELGLYFSDNNISHNLNVRPKTSSDNDSIDEPTSAVEKRIRQSISFKPNMPMLSRQGFIDLINIEYHKDLDKAHEGLNRAIKAYGIWKELDEMPRSVLPDQSKSTALKSVVEVGENDESAEELEMPPPALPIRPRGGEAKVEALMQREEFDEEKSPKLSEPGLTTLSLGEEKDEPDVKKGEVEEKDEKKSGSENEGPVMADKEMEGDHEVTARGEEVKDGMSKASGNEHDM
ncbi:uncharacterized protein LY89DRAFT_739575 [Mollisia scopiformis]|uniref:ZZ-type domain-containing protein n=1 Tax=Mollisia scopiformis TaxID=149040 RepID=A0A194WUV0_MOLSC|nr:uncharacterized protein LY89DRAFT_739575 [Mollisia scopiformis]KUJ11387.1 hypothetical protein LY89DRAFT_739575 [Mollisia scopiformis]